MRMMTVDSSSDEGSDTYSDCEFMSPVQKKRMRRMSRTLKWVYKDTKQKESMKSFMERAHEENNDEKTEKSIATEVNALPLMELNQSVKTLYTSEKADVLGPILQSEPYKAVTTSGRVKNPFTLTDYYDDISDDSMQSYNSNHDEDSDDQKVIMDEAEDSHDQKMIMDEDESSEDDDQKVVIDEAEDSHDQKMIMDEDESSEDDDQKVVIDEDEYAVEFLGAGRVINPFTLSDYYEDISDASMDTSNSELFTSEHEDLSAEGSDDQDISIIDVDDDSGEDAGDEIIVIDDDDEDENDDEDEDDDEDDVNDDDEDDDDSGDQIVIIEEHED